MHPMTSRLPARLPIQIAVTHFVGFVSRAATANLGDEPFREAVLIFALVGLLA
jgi:hypothetical protein